MPWPCSRDQTNQYFQALTPEERRLTHLYGKLPAKGHLLDHQLEVLLIPYSPMSKHGRSNRLFQARQYFDSGDFALSAAHKGSNIGAITTGARHPLREGVSHPASAVPGSSNVDNAADRELGHQASAEVKMATNLHQTASSDREKSSTD
jgi:hypothetical protein